MFTLILAIVFAFGSLVLYVCVWASARAERRDQEMHEKYIREKRENLKK